MTIIGVYLHCNYNTSESYNNHLHDIKQIEGILNDIMNDKESIIMIGDFNSDPYRGNKFDKILIEMVNSYKLKITIDNKYEHEQDNDKKYITYSGCNNSYSCIDHVIISETASRLKIEFKINQSIINTSDHKSIQCNIKTNDTSMNHTVEKHTIEAEYLPKIKWDDKDHIKIYQNNF